MQENGPPGTGLDTPDLKLFAYLSPLELNLEVLCRFLRDSSSKVQLVDLRGFVPKRLFVGHDVDEPLAAEAAVLFLVSLSALDFIQLAASRPQVPFCFPALFTALALVHQFVAADEELRLALGAVLELVGGGLA